MRPRRAARSLIRHTSHSVGPADDRSTGRDRYDLGRDEARGGHALERHVGRSDDELEDRLKRQPRVSAASTYTDRATAEHVVAQTLVRSRGRIDSWLDRAGNRPNLVLAYNGTSGQSIGRSLRRGSRSAVAYSDALVILRWDRGRRFYVLTSYPEVRR